MKTCQKCGVLFNSRNCGVCAKTRLDLWRIENPDKYKAQTAKYRNKNREKLNIAAKEWGSKNKERVRLKNASYRLLNSDKIKALTARWKFNNAEKIKADFIRWHALNPDANRIYHQNRRDRKRNAGGVLSKGLAEKLFKLQCGKCACCSEPLGDDYHMDHIMPLALGGANEDWNIQLLRQRCNNQKHMKHPIDFMQSRGFLL